MSQRSGKIGLTMSDTMINPTTEAARTEVGVSSRDISDALPVEEARRIKAQAEYDQGVADYRNDIEVASQLRWSADPGALTCM